jgi:chromate transport protein ChrA
MTRTFTVVFEAGILRSGGGWAIFGVFKEEFWGRGRERG